MLFSSTFIYDIHSNTSYFTVAQHLSYTFCKFNHHQCSSASKLWLSGWNNKMPHLKTVNDWTYWFSKFCRTCSSTVGDTMSVWYIDLGTLHFHAVLLSNWFCGLPFVMYHSSLGVLEFNSAKPCKSVVSCIFVYFNW